MEFAMEVVEAVAVGKGVGDTDGVAGREAPGVELGVCGALMHENFRITLLFVSDIYIPPVRSKAKPPVLQIFSFAEKAGPS
jgi:hypothetical protein